VCNPAFDLLAQELGRRMRVHGTDWVDDCGGVGCRGDHVETLMEVAALSEG
jgi:hypothetical protein